MLNSLAIRKKLWLIIFWLVFRTGWEKGLISRSNELNLAQETFR